LGTAGTSAIDAGHLAGRAACRACEWSAGDIGRAIRKGNPSQPESGRHHADWWAAAGSDGDGPAGAVDVGEWVGICVDDREGSARTKARGDTSGHQCTEVQGERLRFVAKTWRLALDSCSHALRGNTRYGRSASIEIAYVVRFVPRSAAERRGSAFPRRAWERDR
jgi:hypothetical protein